MARMVEIDEEDLRKAATLRNTVSTLMSDPESKLLLQKALKKKFPNAVTPELDAQEASAGANDTVLKEVEAVKKQIADDKAEREKREKIDSLTGSIEKQKLKFRRAGWFDEDIAAVEKLMEEKGTTDFEMAAALYEKNRPPPQVATPSGVGGWNFAENVADTEVDLKKLLESKGNNEALADKMAREALQEVRGQARR